MPELSIIVPVYNKEAYLDECLESILQQTFSDFELILVNDGSTDDSYAKCCEYQKRDSRIVLLTQENLGVSAARNAGLISAAGKFIGFIDSDDSIEPDMYQLLIHNAKTHGADISGCMIRVIYRHKNICAPEDSQVKILNHDEALCAFLRREIEVTANNKVYKREIVESLRFDGRINEDILFGCKAFLAAQTTVFANAAKYNYIKRENSVSLEKFSVKYMESIDVSAKMVELIAGKDTSCVEEGKAWDIVANLSMLNLILLTGPEKFTDHYGKVVKNLKRYSGFIRDSPRIRKKHKFAYLMFCASPKLYRLALYSYGRISTDLKLLQGLLTSKITLNDLD